jgi:hypothetical protein
MMIGWVNGNKDAHLASAAEKATVIQRRSFLKKAVTTLGSIILAGYIGAGMGCKSPTVPEPPPEPPTPTSVTVRATFFNHIQGPIGEKTYSGISGQSLVIKVSDVYASNVDSQRIAVREAGSSSGLGKFVGFSRNREVSTTYPKQNMDYDVFLMNTSAGADYQLIDNWIDKAGGVLEFNPNASWRREDKDGKTGPEEPINIVISALSDAINYSWRKYGSLTKVSSGANFGVGYHGGWPPAYHSSTWAGLNPDYCKTDYCKLTVFNEEIFELLTSTDDLNGTNTWSLICDTTGRFNVIGRDLLAYVYVKDSKSSSSLAGFKFSEGDLEYFRKQEFFKPEFLKYLKEFKFGGDVYAVREGTAIFPNQPVLRVTAKRGQAQFVETAIRKSQNRNIYKAGKHYKKQT